MAHDPDYQEWEVDDEDGVDVASVTMEIDYKGMSTTVTITLPADEVDDQTIASMAFRASMGCAYSHRPELVWAFYQECGRWLPRDE
jgi:hypothetical protein